MQELEWDGGRGMWVANGTELVDVAVRIAHDDKASISAWMEAGMGA